MRYYSTRDLLTCGLLDYSALLADVKHALTAHESQLSISAKATVDFSKTGKLVAAISSSGPYSCCKWLTSNNARHAIGMPRSTPAILLNENHTGEPVAIFDASLISALRTAAYVALSDPSEGFMPPLFR